MDGHPHRRLGKISGMDTTRNFLPDRREFQQARARSFCRACYTFALHEARGGGVDALGGPLEDFARKRWENDNYVARIIRSASSPMDTSATAIAATAVSDFIGSLALVSGAAQLINAASLRLRNPGAVSVTVPWVSSLAGAGFVAEDEPIPVLAGSIVPVEVSTVTKIALILTLSNQLLRSSNGEIVFEAALRRAAALALDAAIFSDTAASAAQPAGLLNGLSPVNAGSTLDDNLMALGDAITAAGGDANLIFITSPGRALKARALAPNAALPIYGSAAVASDTFIGICASGFFNLIGAPEIRASRETVLHMDDVPAALSEGSSFATPQISLFQTDATGLLCELSAGWGIAPGLCAFVDSPVW